MALSYVIERGLVGRLDFSPIRELVHQGGYAPFRRYELMRLQSPDDLVHYVDVVASSRRPQRHAWWPGAHRLSRTGRHGVRFRLTNNTHFPQAPQAIVDAARKQAASWWGLVEVGKLFATTDPNELPQHEMALIERREHPNDLLLAAHPGSNPVRRHFRRLPNRPLPPEAARLVWNVLAMPTVKGYAQRGLGDFGFLHAACTERYRRSDRSERYWERSRYPISVLGRRGGPSTNPDTGEVEALDRYPEWMRGVRWQFEGLFAVGLFYDEGGFGGVPHYQFLQPPIDAVLSTYRGPPGDPDRRWFRHVSGLHFGIAPGRLREFAEILARHDLRADD
jgi:hypothetical protein